jgi:hypothetical protein
MPIDDDPSKNTTSTARFWDCSVSALRRDIREGRHPPPDYRSGQYAFWKTSTLVRERERRIAASAAKAERLRAKQVKAAAIARAGRRKPVTPGSKSEAPTAAQEGAAPGMIRETASSHFGLVTSLARDVF